MSVDFTDFIEKHKDLKFKKNLIINGKEKVLKEKTRWYSPSDVKKFVKNNQDEIIFGFDWSFIVFKDFIYGTENGLKEDSRKVSFDDLDKIKIKVGKKDHGIYYEGEESVKLDFVFAGHHNKAFDLTLELFQEFKDYIKSQIGESQVEVIDKEDQKPQVKESQVEVIEEEDQDEIKKRREYHKSIRSKIDVLVEKYKNESWMMSAKEVNKKRNSFFDNRFKVNIIHDLKDLNNEIYCGVNGSNSGGIILFSDKDWPTLSMMNLGDSDHHLSTGNDDPGNRSNVFLYGNIRGYNIRFMEFDDTETFPILDDDSDGIYFGSTQYPRKVSLKKGAVKFVKELLEIVEEERVNSNKQKRNSFLSKYDKDGNGVLDIVDSGGDLSELVKKNQKKITEHDKNYLDALIKLSIFLKTKRKNIQSLFDNLEGSSKDFDKVLDTIKIQIEAYSKLALLSMRMVNCLIEDDLFTYLEIYNGFEAMGVFRSSFENELSSQLKDIGSNMGEIINSINEMDSNITSGLDDLSDQLYRLED
tara:strand:- start:1333 stop:2913 length:1581 start_codon:yes stop_codon:yes gene_type:complete